MGDSILELHYAPDNASLILRLAMEEAGVPYKTILVDRAIDAQNSPRYLALNPTGKIPTLVTPVGPISETGACLLWLCDSYPGSGLGPDVGESNRAVFLRWLFYLSNTVHADLIRIFYPDRFVPQDALDPHHEMMTCLLRHHLDVLESAVASEPDLFAAPSVLALYLGPLLRWSALYPTKGKRWLDLASYPALQSLVISLEARESVAKVVAAEGLGATPFTNPQHPSPPEGSAL